MIDRRVFLAQASSLGLTVGGAMLVGCGTNESADSDRGATARPTAALDGARRNADSRLDTSLVHPAAPTSSTSPTTLQRVVLERFGPELPPPPASDRLELRWHARDVPIRISDDIVVSAWTFEGSMPGPIAHCRVGDTVDFTLTNEVDVPHSMDFHAAQIDPRTAFRSVPKGRSVRYSFTPKYAGAFLYHCGTAPVLMHMGSGMHGAIIVSPRAPLPPAREFVLVQAECYLAAPGLNGLRAFDYQKMLGAIPDIVAFNGRPDQYMIEPIRVKRGERVRFWVVNAGPTHSCSFHVVGEQFDTIYLGAPPESAIHGVQTWSVAPGGGTCFELVCDVAGEFPFVNHAFGHGQKGAMGILAVE